MLAKKECSAALRGGRVGLTVRGKTISAQQYIPLSRGIETKKPLYLQHLQLITRIHCSPLLTLIIIWILLGLNNKLTHSLK
jgi:hypothetical protein